jgi:hypothetical protein
MMDIEKFKKQLQDDLDVDAVYYIDNGIVITEDQAQFVLDLIKENEQLKHQLSQLNP